MHDVLISILLLIFTSNSSLALTENDLPNDTIEHLNFVPVPSDATPTALTPPASYLHKSILDVLDENSPTTDFIRSSSVTPSLSNERKTSIDSGTAPAFDENKSNISSSIGPAVSSPSPSSARHYKPISLSSTQTYFNQIQQRQRSSSPNIQNVQTILHRNDDNDDDDDDHVVRPRTSSMKHGTKKETIASVRFVGKDENGKKPEETYL